MAHSGNKRWTMALDAQRRRAHKTLLAFAGLAGGSGGFLSITDVQEMLLEKFPGGIGRFEQYESYFGLSTFFALLGGLIFLLYPVALTLWFGRVFVPMSLLYFTLGCFGLLSDSPVALYIVCGVVIFVGVATQLSGVRFYFRTTKCDGWLLTILAVAMLAWAGLELHAFPFEGGGNA